MGVSVRSFEVPLVFKLYKRIALGLARRFVAHEPQPSNGSVRPKHVPERRFYRVVVQTGYEQRRVGVALDLRIRVRLVAGVQSSGQSLIVRCRVRSIDTAHLDRIVRLGEAVAT